MITLSKKIATETAKEIKEKNPKVVESTTIEDAHGKDIYVAEAEGSRGRASNVEEVRQEVLNIINKMPSGFAYQGSKTASIIFEFTKTAEWLDDQGFHEQAKRLDAAAEAFVELVSVAAKKKTDEFIGTLDWVDEAAASTAPVSEDFVPGAGEPIHTKPATPADTHSAAGHAVPAPAAHNPEHTLHPPQNVDVVPDAKKTNDSASTNTAEPEKKSNKWSGRAAKAVGSIFSLISLADMAKNISDGNYGSAAISGLTGISSLAPMLAKSKLGIAAMIGGAALTAITAVASSSLRESLAQDIPDAKQEINSFLADPDYQGVAKELLKKMSSTLDVLSALTSKLTSAQDVQDFSTDLAAYVSAAESLQSDFNSFVSIGRSQGIFRRYFGFPKLSSAIDAVVAGAEETATGVAAVFKTTLAQIKLDNTDEAKQTAQPAKKNNDRIKGLQHYFGLKQTGTEDGALLNMLKDVSDDWVGFGVPPQEMNSRFLLDNATEATLLQMRELWNNREYL